jgi:UDP-3-O-[3-hydroxymyristoyl] glucosamine N-acyltransferase
MKLRDIAARLGVGLEGDGDIEITGVAGVREARPGDLTFVSNPRYAAAAAVTRAAAAIVPADWRRPVPCALLRVDRPDEAIARIAELFAPPPVRPAPGVHPAAVVAPGARLGADVSIGPHCTIEPGAEIGDRTVLFAGCYVGHDSIVGPDGLFHSNVSVRERVRIGARAILHNGVVVGSDGFGYTADARGVRTKIPQNGTVEIGDDVEIGANSTIDRARFGRTVIGNGVKIDNLVQIAHNVVIGDHAVIVAQVGISGSSVVEARAVLGGQVGVAGHLTIGEGAIIGAQSGISKNVAPGAFYFGSPAVPMEKFTRTHAHLMRLGEWRRQLDEMEKRLARLESGRPSA